MKEHTPGHPLLFNSSPVWKIATPHIELGHNPHICIMTVVVSELHYAIGVPSVVTKGDKHRGVSMGKKETLYK